MAAAVQHLIWPQHNLKSGGSRPSGRSASVQAVHLHSTFAVSNEVHYK